MKRILVTGAAGFIGSHLCEKLLQNGEFVIGIDNFNDYYDSSVKRRNIRFSQNQENFRLHEVDIRSNEFLNLMNDLDVDHIVHLAARAGVIPSVENPNATFTNNVIGTQNILEVCRRYEIPKLTAASSSSVYGSRTGGSFKETDMVSTPESPYAASKVMNEIMGYAFNKAYGTKMTFLRFFTVYGPRQRPDMAIHAFVRRIVIDKHLTVYGSPKTSRDYTYIDDIVSGVISAINYDGDYDIFNLGNSSPVFLGDLVDIILELTDTNVDVEWLPGRVGDVPMTYADISKAENILGYSPDTSIRDGVENFVKWFHEVTDLI
ncbi:MAG: hypothetical protein BAJATHORv1_50111 [Candidatus Thorarchaeota archaeon]|nr:MAG: hypothetical protein BAJATHORv1_50111 [Candidatus Thorarchaeota archaeon]